MLKKISLLLCCLLFIFTFIGCTGVIYSGEVEIMADPPPPRYEIIPPSPGTNYFWVGGRWYWNGYNWVWRPGYYGYARRGYSEWVPGHWERRGGRWAWIRGRWR